MRNTAIALLILSSVVSLFGGYLRDRFVCADEGPIDEEPKSACKVQKRLYVGFLIMAGLGLAFAVINALAFAIFHLSDTDAFWTAIAAGAWSAAVLALFVATYGALRKAKIMLEP